MDDQNIEIGTNLPNLVSFSDLSGLIQHDEFSLCSGKRILITGASGMVGSYLSESIIYVLKELGQQPAEITILVRGIDNPNLQYVKNAPGVELVVTDLSRWKPDKSFDFVIHAASPASPTQYDSPEEIQNSNIGFLRNLLDSDFEIGKILFISSGEIYGVNAPVPILESYKGSIDTSSKRSNYPLAKLAGETITLSHTGGRVARLFHSYGPGVRSNDGRSFADFLWAASRGKEILLRSAGSDVRTFLYTQDSVIGLLKVLFAEEVSPIINVGSSVPLTIKDFALAVANISNSPISFDNHQIDENYVPSPNHMIIPSTQLLESLGWRQSVGLEEGIKRTLNWIYKSKG